MSHQSIVDGIDEKNAADTIRHESNTGFSAHCSTLNNEIGSHKQKQKREDSDSTYQPPPEANGPVVRIGEAYEQAIWCQYQNTNNGYKQSFCVEIQAQLVRRSLFIVACYCVAMACSMSVHRVSSMIGCASAFGCILSSCISSGLSNISVNKKGSSCTFSSCANLV